MDHQAKRQRVSYFNQEDVSAASLVSLRRPVTPPIAREPRTPSNVDNGDHFADSQQSQKPKGPVIRSPIQLTHIRDLPSSSGNNVDAVRLKDILGDPMIRECWQFNYCFDVDFVMAQFDADVKDLVQVKIVHGSWKRDSPTRIRVDV